MTKEDLWNIFIKKNPSFITKPTTFTPDGLRKFFDQTWDQGFRQACELVNKTTNDTPEFIQDLFKGFDKK